MTLVERLRDYGLNVAGHFGAEFREAADTIAALEARNRLLEARLLPFVSAYQVSADPIGDSDLYDEQPRSVHVTLGDCRNAARALVQGERNG